MWCKYVSKYGIRDISAIVNVSVDVTHRLIYKHCGHPEHPAPAIERSSNTLCSRVENTLCHKRRILWSFPIMRVLTHMHIHTEEHIWDSQAFLHVFQYAMPLIYNHPCLHAHCINIRPNLLYVVGGVASCKMQWNFPRYIQLLNTSVPK